MHRPPAPAIALLVVSCQSFLSFDRNDGDAGSSPAVPTQMSVEPRSVTLRRGAVASLTVRRPPSRARLELDVEALPAGVTASPSTLEPDAVEGTITLTAATDATPEARPRPIRIVPRGVTLEPATVDLWLTGQSGELDKTFGNGGFATVKWAVPGDADNGSGVAVRVTTDGKLVLVGSPRSPLGSSATVVSRFAAARFLPDGTLDRSFGTEGRFVDASPPLPVNDAFSAQLAPDGSLVFVGRTRTSPAYFEALVLRVDDAGNFVATWGDNGRVRERTTLGTNYNHEARALVALPDRRFVIAGQGYASETTKQGVMVLRLLDNGQRDSSWLMDDTEPISTLDEANDLAPTSNGSLIVVGAGTDPARNADDSLMLKLTDVGQFDPAWGEGIVPSRATKVAGATSIPLGLKADQALGVAIAAGDAAVVVGFADQVTAGDDARQGYALRLRPEGTLDSGFAVDGRLYLRQSSRSTQLNGIALDAGGRAVAIGTVLGDGNAGEPGPREGLLVRFDAASGKLDESFGAKGLQRGVIGGNETELRSVALQSDGRIVVGGTARQSDGSPTALIARFWP